MSKLIGRAKIDVTPTWPVDVVGHAMRHAKSTGCHDPLECHVLALEINGTKACFMNTDVIGVSKAFADQVKDYVYQNHGVAQPLTVFSVTHTHTGPNFGMSGFQAKDEQYEAYMFDKVKIAIDQAFDAMRPFDHVVVRQDDVVGFYGNRNSLDKPGDPLVNVIEFYDHDQLVAAMVNMSCHSTVLNPMETNLSADLLGNVRRKLSAYLGVEPMMANGNAGDISNRLYRHNNDFAELDRVCSGVAARIAGFNHPFDVNVESIDATIVPYVVDYDQDTSELTTKKAELQQRLATCEAFDDRKWLISEIAGVERKLATPHVHLDMESTIIHFGDIEMVVVPCELASAFGRQIRKASASKVCFVWGYANGMSTYVVEASEFNGGHDGISTSLRKGDAETYVGTLIKHL